MDAVPWNPDDRCSEQAIVAVVLEAYVNGVSTRKVDRLVEQLGIDGMTKDRVSAICRALDQQVELFRGRPLEGAYPYLWLDAKQVKVRDHGRVVIACSLRRRGSRKLGKYAGPDRFFGINNSSSPTLVSHARCRYPLRCVTRVPGATSPRPAPTSALTSASITSRATSATASRTKSSSRPSIVLATTSATVML